MDMRWTLGIVCLLAVLTVCSADKKVPKQMRQLYKQYKRGIVHEDNINTVRYVPAQQGSVTSQRKLLFSLDALHKQGETVIRAELHFYRRTIEAMKTIQIDVSEVSPYYITLVQRQRLSPSGKGWQQMDITKTVRQCTNTINSYNKMGIAFSDVNPDMVAVPVNMPQFLKHHGLPFILLYSNNTRTLEMDQVINQNKLSAKELVDELGSMIDPQTGKASVKSKNLYHKTKRSVMDNKIDIASFKSGTGSLPAEQDTWVNGNELTNELDVKVGTAPSTTDVEALTVVKSKVNDTALESVKEDKKSSEQTTSKVEYIPWPIKWKHKKRKYKGKRGQLLPLTWKRVDNFENNKGCGRKSLRINFEDIGWGNRIIEPKKFDAYYCSGMCGFPYAYGKQLTNHATLQGLITSIQKLTNVPQPCCVPQKLEPVTLMFYDDYKNIVLKTYTDMSVESCVCR